RRALERERLAVGEAQARDLDAVCGRLRRENTRTRGDALPGELLGEAAERAEVALELGTRDERAAVPPDRAAQQAARLERLQCVAHGHAAHAVLLGERALRGQAVAGGELPVGYCLFDVRDDRRVLHARTRSPFGS